VLVPASFKSMCEPGRDGVPVAHAAADLSGFEAPQSAARRILRETLAGLVDGERKDDIVLAADELVGNAVQHVGTALLGISLDVYEWGVVVEVTDGGEDSASVPSNPSQAGEEDENGRGLLLVDLLASAWNVQPDVKGKRVVAIFLHRVGDADR